MSTLSIILLAHVYLYKSKCGSRVEEEWIENGQAAINVGEALDKVVTVAEVEEDDGSK